MSGRLLEAVHTRQETFAFVRAQQSQGYAAETVKWSPLFDATAIIELGLTSRDESVRRDRIKSL
jgi:hypothetical protein